MTTGTRVTDRDGNQGTIVDVRTIRGLEEPVYAVRLDNGNILIKRDGEIEPTNMPRTIDCDWREPDTIEKKKGNKFMTWKGLKAFRAGPTLGTTD